MSGSTTTFLTITSVITETPPPVELSTTWTLLVPVGSTTTLDTESDAQDSTQSSLLSTFTNIISSTGMNSSTIGVMPTPAITQSPFSSSTQTAISKTSPSKPTSIFLGVLIPLLAIFIGVAVCYIRTRQKKSKLAQDKAESSVRRWITKKLWFWPAESTSVDELPWQMLTVEAEEIKDAFHQSAPPSTPSVPPVPLPSPFRSVPSQPSRPSRPTSLSGSIIGVIRTAGSDSYTGGKNCERDDFWTHRNRSAGDISSISGADLPLHKHPRAYDGTRKVFYETAFNRNLPFGMLAKPSLRLPKQQESDPDRSLTPEPLRIAKKTFSGGTMVEQSSKREEGTRRAHTEPMAQNPWAYVTQEARRSPEQDLVDEMTLINDGPIDEEVRRRQRGNTLNFLEGLLPISQPTDYRNSSVYSMDQRGNPLLDQSENSELEARQNAADAGDSRGRKDKGRDIEVSESGGNWI